MKTKRFDILLSKDDVFLLHDYLDRKQGYDRQIDDYIIEKDGYLLRLKFTLDTSYYDEYNETVTPDFKVDIIINKDNKKIGVYNLSDIKESYELMKIHQFVTGTIDIEFNVNITIEDCDEAFKLKRNWTSENLQFYDSCGYLKVLIENFDLSNKINAILISHALIHAITFYGYDNCDIMKALLNKFLYYGYNFDDCNYFKDLLYKKYNNFEEAFKIVMESTMRIFNTLPLLQVGDCLGKTKCKPKTTPTLRLNSRLELYFHIVLFFIQIHILNYLIFIQ